MKRHNDDKVSKTEKKRRKEQRVVEEMIKLVLPQKSFQLQGKQHNVPGVQDIIRLCKAKE